FQTAVVPFGLIGIREHHLFQGGRVLIVALHVDVKELELAVVDAGLLQAVDKNRVHSRHYTLRSKGQKRAGGHWSGFQAEVQILANEPQSAVEVLYRVQVDRKCLLQKLAEQLCVPSIRVGAASLLPQVFGEPRAVVVVIAVGHEGSNVTSEVS